jgi:HEAT repeat protein
MEWDVRAEAIQALEKIGDKRAAPAVIDRLGDVEEIVRHHAAIALGTLGDERAVDPLIHALGDSSKYVRDKSAVALGSIGDTRAVEPLVAAVRKNSGEAANALVKMGQSAVLPLIRELDCPNRDSLWKSITVLGMIGDERAVKPLSRHLFTEDTYIRGAAANALKRVGRPAKKLMVEMLSAKDWWGRCGAAQVLRELGDEHAVEPLSAMLEKPNYVTNDDHYARRNARLAAAEALVEIGDERARNGLHAAIVHGSVHLRVAAARALIRRRILDSTSVQPLIEVLRKYWENDLYLQALAMVGEAAVEPLAKELPNLSPYTRAMAIETLGEMGDVRAVDHLIGWLDADELEVRRAAAKALEHLGWSIENGRGG